MNHKSPMAAAHAAKSEAQTSPAQQDPNTEKAKVIDFATMPDLAKAMVSLLIDTQQRLPKFASHKRADRDYWPVHIDAIHKNYNLLADVVNAMNEYGVFEVLAERIKAAKKAKEAIATAKAEAESPVEKAETAQPATATAGA